jgi:methionyl-tRNA formyltransferase
MKIIFFGTSAFAAKTLSYLLQHGVEVLAVITKPDRPKGRSGEPVPTPVKQAALSQNPPIPVYQPEIVSEPAFAPTLETYHADLFVVVAYGEIIKQHLLDMPKLGCINLHASLLPKYRGAAPIQRSIMDGESETGVTIIHMVKKMDAGDMIKTVVVPITQEATFPEIESALCDAGSKVLLEVIHQFANGTVTSMPQDVTKITFAAKVELEDCEIDWHKPAQMIHNLVRGVTPQPGAWCYVTVRGEKKRLKINKTQVVDQAGTPGEILAFGKEGLIIGCADTSVKLLDIQLEGKKRLSADEWIRGLTQSQLSFTLN